jgi:23S rRNA pseudouridine2605 synthase
MLERLQKIISRAGIASRRHAEDLIRSGQVRVNGVVITELGAKADPERDRVEAAGKVAQASDARVYLLMNKPPEVVSTLADPEGRRTLRNFLVGVSERVFPVGRLDYAAGGAIFLTNDGELASRMLKASAALPQTYWIKVKGRLNEAQMKSLAQILRGKVFPLRAPHAAGKNPPNPWYEAQFSGVRRDLLRQNLLAIGHPVEKMKRMKLASLDADTVPEGHYRQLDAPEVAKLIRAVDLALAQPKPLFAAPKSKRAWRPRRVTVKTDAKPIPDSKSEFRSGSNFNSKPDFKPKSSFGPKSSFKPESKFKAKPGFKFKSKSPHR